MPALVVNEPDGIDGNGFSFAALSNIDFANGQLVSSSSDQWVIQFDDDLSVVINGTDLGGFGITTSIVVCEDGDPLVTVHANEFLYAVYDTILAGGVAGVMSGIMSTADMWGYGNQFYGSQQGDILTGTNGSDELHGYAGDDVLVAGDDRWDPYYGTLIEIQDTLNGGAGNDTLSARTNGDTVTGGADADRFVLTGYLWYFPGTTSTVITDFSSAQGDQIDLSPIGGAAFVFTFIGTAAFTGTGVEVRYSVSGGGAWVSLDGDGDGSADDGFALTGVSSLQASDFIL